MVGLSLRADWLPTPAQERFFSALREAFAADGEGAPNEAPPDYALSVTPSFA